jgi:hypothetical protein
MRESNTPRKRLPNRREAETFDIQVSGLKYTVTISRFLNGGIGEVFLSSAKAGSHSDAAACDSAVVASIALQYGARLESLRRALLRDSHGLPATPLGVALDFLASQGAGDD